jgi:hypothetical protein
MGKTNKFTNKRVKQNKCRDKITAEDINDDILFVAEEEKYENIVFIKHFNIVELFIGGKLEILQRYYNENPKMNFYYTDMDEFMSEYSYGEWTAISVARVNGHKDMVKWLLDTIPKTKLFVDNYEIQFEFNAACIYGQLKIAQMLYAKFPNDIKIGKKDFDYTFTRICTTIDYNLLPDVRYKTDLSVAKWIQSLCPHLYVINDSGEYYIRREAEKRWQSRKYACWLASNNSPNKDSVFYKIPEDVSRYIISNYL